jgi:hypothetical protein
VSGPFLVLFGFCISFDSNRWSPSLSYCSPTFCFISPPSIRPCVSAVGLRSPLVILFVNLRYLATLACPFRFKTPRALPSVFIISYLFVQASSFHSEPHAHFSFSSLSLTNDRQTNSSFTQRIPTDPIPNPPIPPLALLPHGADEGWAERVAQADRDPRARSVEVGFFFPFFSSSFVCFYAHFLPLSRTGTAVTCSPGSTRPLRENRSFWTGCSVLGRRVRSSFFVST